LNSLDINRFSAFNRNSTLLPFPNCQLEHITMRILPPMRISIRWLIQLESSKVRPLQFKILLNSDLNCNWIYYWFCFSLWFYSN